LVRFFFPAVGFVRMIRFLFVVLVFATGTTVVVLFGAAAAAAAAAAATAIIVISSMMRRKQVALRTRAVEFSL
jgi:hypothetical protein